MRPPSPNARTHSWNSTEDSHSCAWNAASRADVNGNSSVAGMAPLSTVSCPTLSCSHRSLPATGTALSCSTKSTANSAASSPSSAGLARAASGVATEFMRSFRDWVGSRLLQTACADTSSDGATQTARCANDALDRTANEPSRCRSDPRTVRDANISRSAHGTIGDTATPLSFRNCQTLRLYGYNGESGLGTPSRSALLSGCVDFSPS